MVMVFNKTGFESWIEDLCFSLSFQNALSPHPHGGGHPTLQQKAWPHHETARAAGFALLRPVKYIGLVLLLLLSRFSRVRLCATP